MTDSFANRIMNRGIEQMNADISHDPLCPDRNWALPEGGTCNFCALIASVRADERERIAQACEVAANYLTSMDILDDTLAEARGLYRAAKIARGSSE